MTAFEADLSQPDDESVMVKLIGEFAGLEALEFEIKLMSHLEAAKKRLILNMSEVPYLDSAALGLLMKTATAADGANKKLILLAPSEGVMKVLKITKTDKQFEIIEDLV